MGNFDGEPSKWNDYRSSDKKTRRNNNDDLSMIQMKGKKWNDENPSVSDDEDDFHMSHLIGRDD